MIACRGDSKIHSRGVRAPTSRSSCVTMCNSRFQRVRGPGMKPSQISSSKARLTSSGICTAQIDSGTALPYINHAVVADFWRFWLAGVDTLEVCNTLQGSHLIQFSAHFAASGRSSARFAALGETPAVETRRVDPFYRPWGTRQAVSSLTGR